MKPDFSGYASRAGVVCDDGLTILAHAFKDHHGQKVPLLWQHLHDDPDMVIGHAIVEDRDDGTYVRGYLNQGKKAQSARHMLANGDIDSMSIFANRLVRRGYEVVHGILREVSLVLAGANSGARIENISIQHSDGTVNESNDEVIIYSGSSLEHASSDNEGDDMADSNEENEDFTLEEVYDSLNEDQKELLHYLVGESLAHSNESDDDEDSDEDSDSDDQDDSDDSDEDSDEDSKNNKKDQDDADDKDKKDLKHDALNNEEKDMTHRVFDKNSKGAPEPEASLTHSQLQTIVKDAQKHGSLADSFVAHAGDYGIDDIDILFPDAKTLQSTPEFQSRRMEWVKEVIDGTKHIPFSRIKSIVADITPETARARGYVKGSMKKDEVFGLLSRVTTPTTIYKKQKLDRDDILDVDIDVVTWLKAEMRLMLEEELARAILLGDGRPVTVGGEANPDKVKDPAGSTEGAGIRSIVNDHELYAEQVQLPSGISVEDRIDELVRARTLYRGSGQPKLFTTLSFITSILLHKDKMGRRVYDTLEDVASAFMVTKIVPVEPMEEHQDIVGIFVNLADYSVGTDKGGEIKFFDDFDIDFNQEKYLLETRGSGALTKIKSAVVVKRAVGTLVTPVSPDFDGATNTITIPSKEGVEYLLNDTPVSAGNEVIDADALVTAVPAEGYDFPTGVTTSWAFTFTDIEE